MTTQAEQRQGLFREQAVQKQHDRLLGDVLVTPPLSYSLIATVTVILVLAATALLIKGTYARKETAMGVLTPGAGEFRVYADRSGTIRKLFVSEGDSVVEGQPLFVVNGDRVLESGENLEAMLLEEYLNQRAMIQQQLTRLPSYYQNLEHEIDQRINATQTDIDFLERQSTLLDSQLDIIQEQRNNLLILSQRSLATQNEADTLHEKHLGLLSQQQELHRNLAAQRNTIEALALQRAQLTFEKWNQRDQLQSNLSAITQNIAQLHGQRAYVVNATGNGVVSNIQVRPGQEAPLYQPIMTITPDNSELLVELLVPTRAIGFIEVGQSVKIRYSAFSYQKFGLYDATITHVSNSVLLPQELQGIALQADEPVYRVTAKLAQQHVYAYGSELQLKPGISLEADIELAERSLFEWLLEPLFSLKGRL